MGGLGGLGQVGGVSFGGAAAQAASNFSIESENFPARGGVGGGGGSGSGGGGGGMYPQQQAAPQQQYAQQQAVGSGNASGAEGGASGGDSVSAPSADAAEKMGKYGLLGLLGVIRMTNEDLNTLALGQDLTSLGLSLNSPDCLYATFSSPWSDASAPTPHYVLPACYYYMKRPPPRMRDTKKLSAETLLYTFYTQPQDAVQVAVAKELMQRLWWYPKQHKLWFRRPTAADGPTVPNSRFIYFDVNAWEHRRYIAPAGSAALGEADFMTADELEQSFANGAPDGGGGGGGAP